jgi:hypothetical protein
MVKEAFLMSQEGVRKVIGKLISDPGFNKEFYRDPKKAIESTGYAVNTDEFSALSKIKPEDFKLVIGKRPGAGVASFSVEEFRGVRTV